MSEITIDIEKQKEAKVYARIKNRLMLVDLAIGGIYVLAWLFLGWSQQLSAWLEQYTNNQWLLVAVFALVFGGIYLIINLPLSYYSGYVLPHRFNLSTETHSAWMMDEVKGLLIGGLLGLLLLEVVYLLLRIAPETWWLWVAGVLLLFTVVLANLAPVLLMPIFNKFVLLGEQHADLEARLLRLAERARTRVRGVYMFDMSRRTTAANAALTGLGNTRRIILADTLVENYTADEIETVLAHELGHQVHKDLLVGIFVSTILTLVGLYLASLGLQWGVRYFGFSSPADVAAMPLFALVMGLYGLVTMPLENTYSRWREWRADQYALESTGNGQAYASALARLTNQNLADANPEPWMEFLLYSHPALGKRIEAARVYATNHPSAPYN